MIYASVCSGIEAPTVAWQPLGWRAAWFAEIDPFCNAVLEHHYPSMPNLGDFTQIGASRAVPQPVDLLVAGTPCQSFSVAGNRSGLDDPRGNLTLAYLALADRLRSAWLVWENVPGVLSDDAGRTFGTVLGTLAELGYGFAYRVLDAQYFGVPQRRRRVFVVGYLGDWRIAAAVLFERQSLSGHPAPCREAGQDVAALTANGVGTCGADDNQGQGGHLIALGSGLGHHGYSSPRGDGCDPLVLSHSLTAHGRPRFDPHGETLVSYSTSGAGYWRDEISLRGRSQESHEHLVLSFCERTRDGGRNLETQDNLAYALKNPGSGGRATDRNILANSQVRRLTPIECERLQGFPDDYTRIPWRGKPAARCPDSPRYRAIGNSMAVPVMRWIGERIHRITELLHPADKT